MTRLLIGFRRNVFDVANKHCIFYFFLETFSTSNFSSFSHGPACKENKALMYSDSGYHDFFSFSSMDVVPCIFCPHWPPEARDFFDRRRPHKWPTVNKIQEIASSGCEFVQVSHPLSKKKLNGRTQWRISFSRAEISLIRSWKNSQKIVYHLLRYFHKKNPILRKHHITAYHLKTLMLWSCEEHPPEYWNSRHLVHIVADMLAKLKQCIQEKRLRNYFIPECNLLFKNCDQHQDSEHICAYNDSENSCDQLSIAVGDLIDWFLHEYLFVFAARCPENESGKMALAFQRAEITNSDITCIRTFVDALISDYKTNIQFMDVAFSIWVVISLYPFLKANQAPCRYACLLLLQADHRFIDFFRAYMLMNSAQDIQESNRLPNHWLINVIVDVLIDYTDDNSWELSKHEEDADTGESYFNKGLFILRMLDNGSESDTRALLLELANCCFRESLEYSDSSTISSAAVICLAAIDYKQRLYNEAIDLCMLLIDCAGINEVYGIDLGLLRALNLPCLSALVGFIELIEYIKRNSSVNAEIIQLTAAIVAKFLAKDILNSHKASVSDPERLGKKLTTEHKNYVRQTRSNEIPNQIRRTHINGFVFNLVSKKPAKKLSKGLQNSTQRKSKDKATIYSRHTVLQPSKILDSLFDSLLELSTKYLTIFLKSLREESESAKRFVITERYTALSSLRCGDYESAIETSDKILERYIQNNADPNIKVPVAIYHTIVNPPFHLLLDDHLKRFISSIVSHYEPSFGPIFIDTEVLALYTKTECLIKLGKSPCDFFPSIERLLSHIEIEQLAPYEFNREIALFQLEKLLCFLESMSPVSTR